MHRSLALAGLLAAACSAPPAPIARAELTLAGPPPFAIPARATWPTAAWPTAEPTSVGIDPAALARLDAYLFTRHGDDHDRKGQRTNAFVLIRRGALVHERYARGYTADTAALTWSVSKSFTSALVGAAVHAGHLRLDDPAGKYYPPLARDELADLRVTDLLRMSSGLDWNETYEASPIFSSVMAMLYTRGRADMPAFVASHDLSHAPGSRWRYSSGDTMLLMAVLRGAVGEAAYADYPWTALFDPLGITRATWERDAAGNYVGSSYLHASARDLAKWGLLYLNDGVWDGRRILPEGWLAYTLTLAPAHQTGDTRQGALVYLNTGDPRPWPTAPADTFAALGHWGKSIFVIPSLDLVAVRLGDDREYGCEDPPRPNCVPDPELAYTRDHYLGLLTALVEPTSP